MPSFCSTSAARTPSHVEASLISTRSRPMPCSLYRAISSRPLAIDASVSNDRRASTSVDTRPGMILRISVPKAIIDQLLIDDRADRLRRVRFHGFFEQRLVVVFLD